MDTKFDWEKINLDDKSSGSSSSDENDVNDVNVLGAFSVEEIQGDSTNQFIHLIEKELNSNESTTVKSKDVIITKKKDDLKSSDMKLVNDNSKSIHINNVQTLRCRKADLNNSKDQSALLNMVDVSKQIESKNQNIEKSNENIEQLSNFLEQPICRPHLNISKELVNARNLAIKFKGSVRRFDNSISFTKWAEIYYEKASKLNLSEQEIINNLVEFMPLNLRIVIGVIPQNVDWSTYKINVEELLSNQNKLPPVKYQRSNEYSNFFDFFQFILTRLYYNVELKDFDNRSKLNFIYNLLDDNFKNKLQLDDDWQSKTTLHEFLITCLKLEKSLGWYCTACRSTTHRRSACLKKRSANFIKSFANGFNGLTKLQLEDYLLIIGLLILILFLIFQISSIKQSIYERFNQQAPINTPCVCPKVPKCAFGIPNEFNFKDVQQNVQDYLQRFKEMKGKQWFNFKGFFNMN